MRLKANISDCFIVINIDGATYGFLIRLLTTFVVFGKREVKKDLNKVINSFNTSSIHSFDTTVFKFLSITTFRNDRILLSLIVRKEKGLLVLLDNPQVLKHKSHISKISLCHN